MSRFCNPDYSGMPPYLTVWTQLTNHFNWRTAKPLGPSTAPGCDEPTSRCRTVPLMWTLGHYQPVIPGVTFVWWSSTVLRTMVGSLSSGFPSARHIRLAVKPAFPFTGPLRFPSGASWPLNFSVTFWEKSAPLKLPTKHCLPLVFATSKVRILTLKEWYFTDDSIVPERTTSKSPTYATHLTSKLNARV